MSFAMYGEPLSDLLDNRRRVPELKAAFHASSAILRMSEF
ncbi:hypothetical protein D516_3607 [Rhodobacter sp. AKP1]|nr:hypothetical protein D516_3607 [Rhodobacter sp. AKP1]